mmetsp:Transcript_7312/g.20010  ORF Transcript_7312/g.20010 Transcript_7312/m.20010 type:complete len:267 (+) Transcript_7312:658-1458(+)
MPNLAFMLRSSSSSGIRESSTCDKRSVSWVLGTTFGNHRMLERSGSSSLELPGGGTPSSSSSSSIPPSLLKFRIPSSLALWRSVSFVTRPTNESFSWSISSFIRPHRSFMVPVSFSVWSTPVPTGLDASAKPVGEPTLLESMADGTTSLRGTTRVTSMISEMSGTRTSGTLDPPNDTTHWWLSTFARGSRSRISRLSSPRINSRGPADMLLGGTSGAAAQIASMVIFCEGAAKGGRAMSISYSRTPRAQRSTDVSCGSFVSISGAR